MRKFLNLLSCLLSVTLAVCFFAGSVLCAMKFGGVERIISDTADGLWGLELVKQAGLSVVLAVLGIALSVCVGAFRVTATIYYFKACVDPKSFYGGSKAWLWGFSFCAFLMTVVFAFAATGGTVVKAGDGFAAVKTFALNAGLIMYAAVCVLPLVAACFKKGDE